MDSHSSNSEFRYEKHRADAVVTLVTAGKYQGCFFTAAGSARRDGAERIGDLLNSETGFFPFQIDRRRRRADRPLQPRSCDRGAVMDDEARRDPGYAVATRRSSRSAFHGQRVDGEVRVYRPEGRDRLSDWTRQPESSATSRPTDATYIVNAVHIVEVTEVSGS